MRRRLGHAGVGAADLPVDFLALRRIHTEGGVMALYERHPLSALFGDMPEAEFAELVADVKANGVRECGYLYEGKVVDGWNRFQAALKAKKQMRFEDYRGSDPIGFVLGKNLHRRHLTPIQRATIVVSCHEWATGGRPKTGPSDPVSETTASQQVSKPATNEQMAQEAQTSVDTLQRAKAKVKAK
jgi:hypothetical protein